jgi:hypothetical protein
MKYITPEKTYYNILAETKKIITEHINIDEFFEQENFHRSISLMDYLQEDENDKIILNTDDSSIFIDNPFTTESIAEIENQLFNDELNILSINIECMGSNYQGNSRPVNIPETIDELHIEVFGVEEGSTITMRISENDSDYYEEINLTDNKNFVIRTLDKSLSIETDTSGTTEHVHLAVVGIKYKS